MSKLYVKEIGGGQYAIVVGPDGKSADVVKWAAGIAFTPATECHDEFDALQMFRDKAKYPNPIEFRSIGFPRADRTWDIRD